MVSLYGNRTAAMTLQNKENNDDEYVCLSFLLFFLFFKEKKELQVKMSIDKNAREEQVCVHTSLSSK